MTPSLDALTQASAPDRTSYRPGFFRLPADEARMEELLTRNPRVEVHDTLHSQLTELVRSLNPSVRYGREELDAAAVAHLGGSPAHEYGVWVHYPWSHKLVHLLDEAEFALVRTDRNRNKITREEQAVLATKKVGVIGLSVGQSVALTMALERSFGEIRLADFDDLELSNLNRIRSGVHEMGTLKVVNTAREIAEVDPFLKVTLFAEGITDGNLDAFLTEGGKLDLLVEECDSVHIKIISRQRAKYHRIPVVMDTSDRGMIDVERFDLEPDRPILHGLVDHLDLEEAAKARTNEEKLPFVLPMVGMHALSPRLKASMMEIGVSVTTWPQLANSVSMGGAVVAATWCRIALGSSSASGRWYVDMEDPESLGADMSSPAQGPKWQDVSEPQPTELDVQAMHTLAGQVEPPHAPSFPFPEDAARTICEAGSIAPSAGNMQPWRFLITGGRIHLFHAWKRDHAAFDGGAAIRDLDMSSCLENMLIKARSLGFDVTVDLFPNEGDERYVAVMEGASTKVGTTDDVLAAHLTRRCTNRHHYDGRPLPADIKPRLHGAVNVLPGCQLHVLEDPVLLDQVADIVGSAERIRFLDRRAHSELFRREVRWSTNDPRGVEQGLELDTFEMSMADRVGMEIASDPRAIDLLRDWNAGQGFKDLSAPGIRSSSAVALISAEMVDRISFFSGGRAAQRLWIAANASGIAIHPIGAPVLLSHHVRIGGGVDLNPEVKQDILELHDRLVNCFNLGEREPVFMFRMGYAPNPSAIAKRRPLAELLHVLKPVSHEL